MKRKLILLSLASLGLTATAQTAAEAGYVEKVITECQRLHSDGEYRSALILIEKIDARNLDERTRQEYELQRALTTFENDHRKGKALMMKYIADYPNTSQEELLNTYIAQSHYFDGDYEGACALFADSDMSRLATAERQRASLYHALSMLETGNESLATDMLQRLKVESRQYATDAIFHLAVIDYEHDRLDEAHAGFKSIQMSDSYYLDIPYYLAATRGCKVKGYTQARSYAAKDGKPKYYWPPFRHKGSDLPRQKYGASRRAWSALAPKGSDLLPSASSLR